MSQKLDDLKTMVKGDRKTRTFGIIIVILVLAMFVVSWTDKTRRVPRKTATQKVEQPKLSSTDNFADLMDRFRKEQEQMQQDVRALKTEHEKTQQAMTESQTRTAEIFKRLLEKMAAQQEGRSASISTSSLGIPPGAPEPQTISAIDTSNDSQSMESITPGELESFGVQQQQVAPPPPPKPEKKAFVGAGDSVRLKLLAGVNAQTDGTPYPVVFKVVSDIYGPDGSVLPIGEARIIAAAQGSITDSRALFRLTSMNLRLPDGRRIVKKIDGWVVGEDGIRGMPGILIDPLGQALAGAGLAAGVSGFGQGLQISNVSSKENSFLGLTTQEVTGSPYEYAVGKSIEGAGKEWSQIIKDRLQEMVPVVQVFSGREATAVFARSISIDGLFQQISGEEEDLY